MQHRVEGVSGKDLIRALHEAPEDMAAWLDPATSGDGRTIQEGMKDERFKSLREDLVSTLAEQSVSFHPRDHWSAADCVEQWYRAPQQKLMSWVRFSP